MFNLSKLKEEIEELLEMEKAKEKIHSHPSQIRRQQKALDKKHTPVTLDRINKTAIFKGSGGKNYETSMESCTCKDFFMRGFPCKHMYRLAHELGEFSLEDIPQTPLEIQKGKIKELSQETLEELYVLLHDWIYRCNEWGYERVEPISNKLIHLGFIEEIERPGKLLSLLPMKTIRANIKEKGLKCPRKKIEAIHVAQEECPELIEEINKKYKAVSFKKELREIRGKLHSYIEQLSPEIYERMHAFVPDEDYDFIFTKSHIEGKYLVIF